jgi:hypothetical protein
MENPAEYFNRAKDRQRQSLTMLGHPTPSEDPLVEHFEKNLADHFPAMKRLGHPARPVEDPGARA